MKSARPSQPAKRPVNAKRPTRPGHRPSSKSTIAEAPTKPARPPVSAEPPLPSAAPNTAEETSDTESEASSIDMLPVDLPKPKAKKPKVFITDTAAMLALINQAADKEDAKLGKRLERQNELKKRYKAQDDEARLKKQKRANQVNEAKSRVIQEVKQRRKQRKQEDQAAEEKKARKSAKKTLRFA